MAPFPINLSPTLELKIIQNISPQIKGGKMNHHIEMLHRAEPLALIKERKHLIGGLAEQMIIDNKRYIADFRGILLTLGSSKTTAFNLKTKFILNPKVPAPIQRDR